MFFGLAGAVPPQPFLKLEQSLLLFETMRIKSLLSVCLDITYAVSVLLNSSSLLLDAVTTDDDGDEDEDDDEDDDDDDDGGDGDDGVDGGTGGGNSDGVGDDSSLSVESLSLK